MAHYLSRGKCKGSYDEIQHKLDTWHGNKKDSLEKKIKAKKIFEERITREIQHPKYIIYDFETDTSSGIHKPNLCVAQVLNVDDEHDYEKSLSETKVFEGYTCCKNFCDWLFTKENSDSTVIAHNQAGYDGKFILSYCI